jgi:hypothetical protein
MPILEVTVVLRVQEVLPEGTAPRLALAAAKVFASAPGHTWVRLRSLAHTDYAEDSGDAQAAPVFVSVLKAHAGKAEALRAEAEALARAFASVLDRPHEQVHILYEPPALGRIAFGGRWLSE